VAAGNAANPAAAAAGARAFLASRTNVVFSIPMLFFMGAARHLTVVDSETPNYHVYYAIVLLLAAFFEWNIFKGTAQTQKPLATVAGTIHAGLGLTLVLFVVASILL